MGLYNKLQCMIHTHSVHVIKEASEFYDDDNVGVISSNLLETFGGVSMKLSKGC